MIMSRLNSKPGIVEILSVALLSASLCGASELESEFQREIRPILQNYCLDCHSTKSAKGDLDLERFTSLSIVLGESSVWQQVVEQVELGEMPPNDKKQPSPRDRDGLLKWVDGAMNEAARARAGDPGPVVLRRLNNAEYTYTIRDLTGVGSLNPAKEFPADSAAGEGFMNTGNSLVMSPSMLGKYLDAGKQVASHAVPLPDGFRFSSKATRADWTEEALTRIRQFYEGYSADTGADEVNLQGVIFSTNEGGRLPIERYLRATLLERERLAHGGSAFVSVAQAQGLSAKYLRSLWEVLNSPEPSLLLGGIRALWRDPGTDEHRLAAEIGEWQRALWKFASVGHIGKAGGPTAWMEPVNPLGTNQMIRLKLAPHEGESEVTVYLVAADAGDGNEGDHVLWRHPRIALPGRPDLLLRDSRDFIAEASARRSRLIGCTAKALAAIEELPEDASDAEVAAMAARHGLRADDLSTWRDCLGASASRSLDYLTNRIHGTAGYDFVNGWGTGSTPFLLANSSDESVRIPGNLKGRGVAVHPSPTRRIAVGWRSPMAVVAVVHAEVTHAHPGCGNGVEWFLDLRRGETRQRLAQGTAQGGRASRIGPVAELSLRKGDLLSLVIGPRDGNHACDLTELEFVIKDPVGGREWNLTRDISSDVLAGNPRPDQFGHEATWHFYTEALSGGSTDRVIPAGSLLAKWQSLPPGVEKRRAADNLQSLLLASPPADQSSADARLYREWRSLGGPLFAEIRLGSVEKAQPSEEETVWSLDPEDFGKGSADDASLVVRAPSVLEIRLPADLVAGAEFVVEGSLAAGVGAEGSVQLLAATQRPGAASGLITSETKVSSKAGLWTSDNRQISYDVPIIVNQSSEARKRIERDLNEFRRWFPAALCYTKIVPVDEVVTLTLYYREDHHLVRLMLDEADKARLDRLWDELHYISHDATKMVDVFEQIWQYATQDADPKVFDPLREPIRKAAAAFRQRLIDTQPEHVDALIAFAERAYRRPLVQAERSELRGLYRDLLAKELSHDDAFRVVLARILVAPAFLYRLEKSAPGLEAAPVTDHELATRLSYFLWSSMPDDELRAAADAGALRDEDELVRQAGRMLKDARVRRLATEFACAWVHVHDFESLDEKSERHFPTFTGLRGAMYEETILFFTHIFQRDASVLEIFNADYTFLNENLAKHYGIPGIVGGEWRIVDGIRKHSRGGILGHSAVLAKQSGASRTSPILRGIWVSETLLGEKLPRPPKDVPQLPEDETKETLTVRQLVEKHTSDPKCYGCHKRIDGYGFALEEFDAIGRARAQDVGGRPVDAHAMLFDGTTVTGFQGLTEYLMTKKQNVVLRQFCRKLLGYSLGRGVLLSDKPLIEEMERQLLTRGHRFNAALETIVRSRQFREIRGIKVAHQE